jgi:hypothetical protein
MKIKSACLVLTVSAQRFGSFFSSVASVSELVKAIGEEMFFSISEVSAIMT